MTDQIAKLYLVPMKVWYTGSRPMSDKVSAFLTMFINTSCFQKTGVGENQVTVSSHGARKR